MQEIIIAELEESYEVSRREKGMLLADFCVLISHLEEAAEGPEDLLVRNPNHVLPSDDGSGSVSEGDEE